MAVRQYIGARYTIKVYENSLDPSSAEWQSGVAYEPLTLVTYNNSSYLSKKQVGAGVGNPAANSSYWVCTGYYNGQIITLQNEIGNLDDLATTNKNNLVAAINENVSDINTLNRLNISENRKFVFVGDSYNTAAHHGGWASKVAANLGLTEGVNYWSSGIGGASFSNGDFLSQLQTIAGGMTSAEKLSITDVVIVGAANEGYANLGTLDVAVTTCENYARSTFPNSRYWIILGEWSYEDANIRKGLIKSYNQIVESSQHAIVIDDAYLNFLVPSFLESDMVHPTSNGMLLLGHVITNALNGGSTFLKHYTDLTATFKNSANNSQIIIPGEPTKDGMHVYRFSSSGIRFDTTPITIPAPGSYVDIGVATAAENYIFERDALIIANALVVTSGSHAYGRIGLKVVNNGDNTWTLKCYSMSYLGGNDFPISNVVGIYPTFDVVLPIYEN